MAGGWSSPGTRLDATLAKTLDWPARLLVYRQSAMPKVGFHFRRSNVGSLLLSPRSWNGSVAAGAAGVGWRLAGRSRDHAALVLHFTG